MIKNAYLSDLHDRLRSVRIDPDVFLGHCSEIIIFGSRSAGVHSEESDLDVLCITQQKQRIKNRRLDCICLQYEDLGRERWFGSELLCHIRKYGIWLTGEGKWRDMIRISNRAIADKERRIVALWRNIEFAFYHLRPAFKRRYQTTFRRELQRLRLLQAEIPIPPTPVLDEKWRSNHVLCEELASLCLPLPGIKLTPLLLRFLQGSVCERMERPAHETAAKCEGNL